MTNYRNVSNLIGGKFRPKGLWVAMDSEWDNDITVEGLIPQPFIDQLTALHKALSDAT